MGSPPQGRWRHRQSQMKNSVLAAVAIIVAMSGQAFAATVVNNGAEPATIIVTEDGRRSEMSVAVGETVTFCPAGCFVTMPNGDREVLTGSETLEFSTDGRARFR